MPKIVLKLSKPMPPGTDCLPHAAMNLGAVGGSTMRPVPRMVSSLVLEEQFGNWVLYRLDENGGFVGDTWHGSKEDAVWQIRKEFGVEVTE